MSAPPPSSPPRQASTAAALVADLRAEGGELAEPPASLFHVNNKYSHRRPLLVCALRLQILLPRPFTPRGAWIRARDRQSLRANQSPREEGGGSEARAWVGTGTPQWQDPFCAQVRINSGTRNNKSSGFFSCCCCLNIIPTCPAPEKEGRVRR